MGAWPGYMHAQHLGPPCTAWGCSECECGLAACMHSPPLALPALHGATLQGAAPASCMGQVHGSNELWWGVVHRTYVTLYHATYSGPMQVAGALGCWYSGRGHGLVAGQLCCSWFYRRTSGLQGMALLLVLLYVTLLTLL